MGNPQKRHNGQCGRVLLDQLSQRLSQHVKGRQESQTGNNRDFGGIVRNLSDRFSNTDEVEPLPHIHQFNSQELQLFLLSLLANKSSHGYDLIKELEARSNGFFTSSPEMLYCALTHLNELGYINNTFYENRKCYAISDVGKQYLASHQELLDELWIKLSSRTNRADFVRRTYPNEPKADENNSWLPELIGAKSTLMNVLIQHNNVSVTEQKRITEVLLHAARTILGKQ